MYDNYVIKDVIPKNGVMRDLHAEVIGCRCYIIDIEPGKRGLIKFEPRYEMKGSFHRLHTSDIIDVKKNDDESFIEIETLNTFYKLECLTSIENYYNKKWGISTDEAMEDIVSYLNDESNDFFSDRGANKVDILSNKDMMSCLAKRHYENVMFYGYDRNWSIENVCNELADDDNEEAKIYDLP